MRAFLCLTRPLLRRAQRAGERAACGGSACEPVDEVAAGRNPDDLRELVDHSAEAGALDRERRDQLRHRAGAGHRDAAARWSGRTPRSAAVAADAGAERDPGGHPATAGTCGWWCATATDSVGVVHVRDTLAAPDEATAAAASCARC